MLREIALQGVLGVERPVRIALGPSLCEIEPPAGVSPEALQALVISLLYPQRLSQRERRAIESAPDPKLALLFERGDHTWRAARRGPDDSLSLQRRSPSGWSQIASGREVEQAVDSIAGGPSFPHFLSIALWQFDRPLPRASLGFSIEQLPERAREMAVRYAAALEIEAAEDELRSAEAQAKAARAAVGEGAALEEKLTQARARHAEIAVGDLSAEEFALLGDREQRLGEFAAQIARLEEEAARARDEMRAALPPKPWTRTAFWVGIAIAIAATAASVAVGGPWRQASAANVVGLGAAAWATLRYYTRTERAGVYVARLESIQRRLAQVREEQVAFGERVSQLLVHAGVAEVDELSERHEKSAKLGELIERMEAEMRRIAQTPAYQQARAALGELEERLKAAGARRDELGASRLSSYQLERDLAALGVDPARALEALEAPEPEEERGPEVDRDAFTRLGELARRAELADERGLAEPVLVMWSRLCAHLLGERFARISLTQAGAIAVEGLSAEQFAMWSRTRPRELRAIAAGLATAIGVHLRAPDLGMTLIPDPRSFLSPGAAAKLREVLKSAARRRQFILIGDAS